MWVFEDGHGVIILSEGRLLNLGNATGHPSFVMSNSFTNQTMAQIELYTKSAEYDTGVHVLPKHLDEKVARLHLDALGVKLTTLTTEQADYIGVPVGRPLQARHLPVLSLRRTSTPVRAVPLLAARKARTVPVTHRRGVAGLRVPTRSLYPLGSALATGLHR